MPNYTTNINTFLFRRSWGEAFADLTDEQAGKLIKAVYGYIEGYDTLPDEPELKTIYKLIVKQLNHSAKKYLDKIAQDYEE